MTAPSSTPKPICEAARRRADRARSAPASRCSRRPACPALRRREGGFAGLCAIVCGAAAFDRQRRRDLGTAARGVRSVPPRRACGARARDQLARLGLSAPKISTIKAIAQAIANGTIDLDALAAMEADEAHDGADRAARHRAVDRRHLSAVLPRPCRRLAGRRPRAAGGGAHRVRAAQRGRTPRTMAKLAEAWRPWRGVAAHLLWAYYRAVKRREGAPVQAADRDKNNNKNGDTNGR